MRNHLQRMLRHMGWADDQIQEALRASTGTGLTPEKAVQLYAHVVAAEHIWLARLEERDTGSVPVFPDWDMDKAADMSRQTVAGYERLLERTERWEQIIVYKNTAGAEFRTAFADMITHVFLHGSYHRGQINLLLRDAGAEPVNVDYITFVRSVSESSDEPSSP